MLKMEEWLLIRDLYSQGFSISETARKTGFDRRTVKKYLKLRTLLEPQDRFKGSIFRLFGYEQYLSIEKINISS